MGDARSILPVEQQLAFCELRGLSCWAEAPIDRPIMNGDSPYKTPMDWILGIHALLVKKASETSEPGQSRQSDASEFPFFDDEAARFVRDVYAGMRPTQPRRGQRAHVARARRGPAAIFEQPAGRRVKDLEK